MMYGYNNGGYNCGGGFGMFGSGWNFIIPIIIIGIIIFAAYKLMSSNQTNNTREFDALDELNRKFINEEISEEEYLRRKKIIRQR